MAGPGPLPKDPSQRARQNKDIVATRVVKVTLAPQPELPTFAVEIDGELTEFNWPVRTREWWAMWRDSPLATEFTSHEWSELLDTAVLHARFWRGDIKLATELRLRAAKYGCTPEDRARLRIVFAQADEADSKVAPLPPAPEPPRYEGLRLAD